MTTLLKILDNRWTFIDDEITGRSTIIRWLKELFLNRGRVKKIHTVHLILENTDPNENVKVLDWVQQNIVGIWNIVIYDTARSTPNRTVVKGQFNREEDALAFKLMWN